MAGVFGKAVNFGAVAGRQDKQRIDIIKRRKLEDVLILIKIYRELPPGAGVGFFVIDTRYKKIRYVDWSAALHLFCFIRLRNPSIRGFLLSSLNCQILFVNVVEGCFCLMNITRLPNSSLFKLSTPPN